MTSLIQERFSLRRRTAKPVAVIWIHGLGVNFYSPTYVAISKLWQNAVIPLSRATRGCMIWNVEAWLVKKRIRGGGYLEWPAKR